VTARLSHGVKLPKAQQDQRAHKDQKRNASQIEDPKEEGPQDQRREDARKNHGQAAPKRRSRRW
jgi:hypothetical protein